MGGRGAGLKDAAGMRMRENPSSSGILGDRQTQQGRGLAIPRSQEGMPAGAGREPPGGCAGSSSRAVAAKIKLAALT